MTITIIRRVSIPQPNMDALAEQGFIYDERMIEKMKTNSSLGAMDFLTKISYVHFKMKNHQKDFRIVNFLGEDVGKIWAQSGGWVLSLDEKAIQRIKNEKERITKEIQINALHDLAIKINEFNKLSKNVFVKFKVGDRVIINGFYCVATIKYIDNKDDQGCFCNIPFIIGSNSSTRYVPFENLIKI
jgi:hypothetical protein